MNIVIDYNIDHHTVSEYVENLRLVGLVVKLYSWRSSSKPIHVIMLG